MTATRAMLLGAARYLCETRNFDGTVVVIFQPNEEGLTGGLAMVEDGLMERFGIQQVYGMHTSPNHELGKFALCAGPMLAACDKFTIEITGKGSHAARPHEGIDPVVIAAQTIMALQTIASRTIDPLDAGGGLRPAWCAPATRSTSSRRASALTGTIRTLSKDGARKTHGQRARHRRGTAALLRGHGTRRHSRATCQSPSTTRQKTKFVVWRGRRRSSVVTTSSTCGPIMGAEDFSHMLNEAPRRLHHDRQRRSARACTIPATTSTMRRSRLGVSYWVAARRDRHADLIPKLPGRAARYFLRARKAARTCFSAPSSAPVTPLNERKRAHQEPAGADAPTRLPGIFTRTRRRSARSELPRPAATMRLTASQVVELHSGARFAPCWSKATR